MVRLNRIYTGTGDDGTTGLVDGSRAPKDDPRIEAIGAVDEASSAIGLARVDATAEVDARLARVQNDLFDLGADLATPIVDGTADPEWALRIVEAQWRWLETDIDRMNEDLAPLKSFILPAGSPLGAGVQFARAVARRAERRAVGAARTARLNPHALTYLNRLSDWLFVLARHVDRATAGGPGEVLWVPAANRGGAEG